ncbi:ABC transporter substrate-binding protein [Leisingera aquimarina]|uniref:ABC transporter substrate-binding protein n=1 Tax=Leisingera aquimarina TaxID=476529 RepID=UPI000423523A|nr:ABC transporter substrate-binding protein [Leisingera aquimarina]
MLRLWLKPPGANPAQPVCSGLLRRAAGTAAQAAVMLLAIALPAAADTFPVEIQHQFGLVTVPAKPGRIVSVSFIGHDFLLALGQTPIALRKWYGNDPSGVWPWGHDALGDARPAVFQGEIDFEKIAVLEPDLIVVQWSGMTWRDYAHLSGIAPTIAPRAEYGPYGTPWQEMLRILGAATGTSGPAETIITRIGSRVSAIRKEHPEWEGASAALAWAGRTAAYTSRDIRSRLLEALGLQVPKAVNGRGPLNRTYVMIPAEDPSPIDADVLIWLDSGGSAQQLARMPLRPTMRASRDGREIHAGYLLAAALSHSSPLSLDYALDHLVPLLEAAMDGDPAAQVPGMAEAGLLPDGF